MSFKGCIKHIFVTVDHHNFVKNELDSTFEVQSIENSVVHNAPFANGSFSSGD